MSRLSQSPEPRGTRHSARGKSGETHRGGAESAEGEIIRKNRSSIFFRSASSASPRCNHPHFPPPGAQRLRRGFTLIETIAAIIILAIAIPPMLWTLRDAHIQRVDPVFASRARWLAMEKLEDIIADRHSTTRGYDYLITGNYPDEPAVAGFTNFSRTVSFAETEADLSTAGDGYLTITVEVEWDDARGVTRTLSISAVVTEYDAA